MKPQEHRGTEPENHAESSEKKELETRSEIAGDSECQAEDGEGFGSDTNNKKVRTAEEYLVRLLDISERLACKDDAFALDKELIDLCANNPVYTSKYNEHVRNLDRRLELAIEESRYT